jgi:hypothetical protein
MDDSGDAFGGALLEDQRVEAFVGYVVVDDIDPFEAADGLEVEVIVEDKQVSSLDERDAHPAGEETVLGVERV